MRTNISKVWGGFAVHTSLELAEADLAELDRLPWYGDVAEWWRALAIPIHHHGETSWLNDVRGTEKLRIAVDDPGGELVVLTSAGYVDPGPDDLPRIRDFIAAIDRSKDFFRSLPNNVAVDSFAGAAVDGHDGMTVSLWDDDKAMMKAAYRVGFHKEQIARHRAAALFDRSSVTRARIVSSSGTWGV